MIDRNQVFPVARRNKTLRVPIRLEQASAPPRDSTANGDGRSGYRVGTLRLWGAEQLSVIQQFRWASGVRISRKGKDANSIRQNVGYSFDYIWHTDAVGPSAALVSHL